MIRKTLDRTNIATAGSFPFDTHINIRPQGCFGSRPFAVTVPFIHDWPLSPI
jgi:hypothetical protein